MIHIEIIWFITICSSIIFYSNCFVVAFMIPSLPFLEKKNYQLTVLLGNNTILLPTMEVVNLLALGSLVVVAQHVWELVKQDLEAKAILFTFICLADILKRVNFTKLQQSASLFQKTTRTLYLCLRKLQILCTVPPVSFIVTLSHM